LLAVKNICLCFFILEFSLFDAFRQFFFNFLIGGILFNFGWILNDSMRYWYFENILL